MWALPALLLLAAAFVLVVFGWASDWGRAAPELSVWWTVGIFACGMLPFVLLLAVGLATGAAAGFNALRWHRS